MFDKILVALDASEHAGPVIAAAGELASKFEATVRVVHVLEMGFAGRAGAVALEDETEVRKVVDDAVGKLDALGVKATGVVRSAQHGKVAGEICDEARDFEATGIVAGSRGLTDLEGVFLGSTTHKLLHLTHLPVLVVR
jgi:nucleotide-binding universal stress UspA family protein